MKKRAILGTIIDACRAGENKPIKILDLVTGPNDFNPVIVRDLVKDKIDYELVLSDISPTHLATGYKNLNEELSPEELGKIKCVLADSRDLRRELKEIPLWGECKKPIEQVLDDSRYKFLQTGYRDGRRTIDFSDDSFDLVIGCIPYGSINTGDYSEAIRESARVLRPNGYHIIDEMCVEEINSCAKRTGPALARAKINSVEIIKSKLDAVLKPVDVFSAVYTYGTEERVPEQTLQCGDVVKMSVLVHKKEN